MDLHVLKTFIAVCEYSGFSSAAEKLGYTQSTVSSQIKQLEKEIGAQLFDRIGHTVTLTDAGRDALGYAQQICHTSQEMLLGSQHRREPAGTLRLGMADSLCEPLIVEHFAQFREAYPKVCLHITTLDTSALLDALDHNDVDMICTMDDHVYDTNYVIADEEEIGVHFVASPRHPLAALPTVALEQLLEEPFLLTEKGMSYRRLMDAQLARSSLAITPVLETGQADLICKLVGENMGLSFLPDYVTEKMVRGRKLKRLDVPGLQVVVWKQLLYRREKWLSAPMRAMIDHIKGIRLTEETP